VFACSIHDLRQITQSGILCDTPNILEKNSWLSMKKNAVRRGYLDASKFHPALTIVMVSAAIAVIDIEKSTSIQYVALYLATPMPIGVFRIALGYSNL
jgi:hypothetical protein